MPRLVTRDDFQTLNALVAEAMALCEAAQENLVGIQDDMQRAIREGRAITAAMAADEDHARARLFIARTRLWRRQKQLSQRVQAARLPRRA